jgi:hypothetical protein
VSHFIIHLRFVFTPSLGLDYISNANPACSCVYICKFQFCPIHPPLGDYHFAVVIATAVVAIAAVYLAAAPLLGVRGVLHLL